MKTFTVELLRIGDISGMLYQNNDPKSSKLVIYALGAPVPPDGGNLPDAPVILRSNVDLFVPDYIGYGRSDGVFTPMNCIRTFLRLHKLFSNGCLATNSYKNIKKRLKYDEIFLIGRSFGGYYLPLLPRFDNKIKNIALIYPVVDYVNTGKITGEEKGWFFIKALLNDGYRYLYRGIEPKVWQKHFLHQDGLCPLDNIKFLKNTRLFIGHGKKDSNIHFSRSVDYFNKITAFFPNRKAQFNLRLYAGSHSITTSNPAVRDYLKWINKKNKPA